ncbi:hypothetical protein BC826DRAFT_968544 [Russula brevipes]|nr:hypothetical protein BC826DRAFT_968544 [Russula brevipes]
MATETSQGAWAVGGVAVGAGGGALAGGDQCVEDVEGQSANVQNPSKPVTPLNGSRVTSYCVLSFPVQSSSSGARVFVWCIDDASSTHPRIIIQGVQSWVVRFNLVLIVIKSRPQVPSYFMYLSVLVGLSRHWGQVLGGDGVSSISLPTLSWEFPHLLVVAVQGAPQQVVDWESLWI